MQTIMDVAVDALTLTREGDSSVVVVKAADGVIISITLIQELLSPVPAILTVFEGNKEIKGNLKPTPEAQHIPVFLVVENRTQQLPFPLFVEEQFLVALKKTERFSSISVFCGEPLPARWLSHSTILANSPVPNDLKVNTAVEPAPILDVQGDLRWITMHQVQADALKEGPSPQIVFAGDSIVNQMLYTPFYNTLQTMNIRLTNLGIGGDQTQHVHWRVLDAKLDQYAAATCKAAVLLVGTNNHSHTSAQVAAGILAIARLLVKVLPRATVLVVEYLPRGRKYNCLRLKREQVNRIVRSGLASIERTKFIETGNSLIQPNGDISPELLQDYLHLTDKGYGILARHLLPQLFATGVLQD